METVIIQRIDWKDDRSAKSYDSIEEKVRDKGFSLWQIENAFIEGVNPVVLQKETEAGAEDLDGIQGYFYGKVDSGSYIFLVGILEPDGRLIIQTVQDMSESNIERYKQVIGRLPL